MRRFLIRLVAVETMLVGWLGYWLFHVYSNNPLVSEGLLSQLGRFPQLAFTTVDIAVLVIISTLSIFFAFKFQRGLRPGIRLERALQMLENLMKRNLVLEAQVAELKLEKAHVSPPTSTTPAEPRLGSWERAFRTPIEAGPPRSPVPTRSTDFGEGSFDQESGQARSASKTDSRTASQRGGLIHAKSFLEPDAEKLPERGRSVFEKGFEKGPEKSSDAPSGTMHSRWEDSPKHVSETGVLLPSPAPKSPAGLVPVSSSKQPYIPVPVPKSTLPPSVIVGPGVSRSGSSTYPQAKGSLRAIPGTQVSANLLPQQSGKPSESLAGKPPSTLGPVGLTPKPNPPPPSTPADPKPEDSVETTDSKEEGETAEMKPSVKPLKKFPYDED